MNIRTPLLTSFVALALSLASAPAQVGVSLLVDGGQAVTSCAFAAPVLDLKAAPGATVTALIGSTPGQPWVLAASPQTCPGLAVQGIDGLLLLEPKSLVVIAGGVTSPLVVSPCDSAPAGAKLAFRVPATTPIGTQVAVQVLAGVGDNTVLKLALSQTICLTAAP